MAKEAGAARSAPEEEIIRLHKINSADDAARELRIIHNTRASQQAATDFFRRMGVALAILPSENCPTTTITLYIDKIEHHVTLQPTGNKLSLSVVKVDKIGKDKTRP